MKALTVQQPWAWAIVHGGKDVENRTQAWSYRGPLAIHAGARWSERGAASPLMADAVVHAAKTLGIMPEGMEERVHRAALMHPTDYELDVYPLGAVIGVVDLVDVHSSVTCIDAEGAMCSPWAEFQYDEHRAVGRDRRRRDIVHLELANPRPLQEPIPCKGRLGLWTVSTEVRARVEIALGAQEWIDEIRGQVPQ